MTENQTPIPPPIPAANSHIYPLRSVSKPIAKKANARSRYSHFNEPNHESWEKT
jgi:hypothetical protein